MVSLTLWLLVIQTLIISSHGRIEDSVEDLWYDDSMWDTMDKFWMNWNQITRKCASFNAANDLCLCYNQYGNEFFACDKQNDYSEVSNANRAYTDYNYYESETGSSSLTTNSDEGAYVWTGFDIQWQNRMKLTRVKPKVVIEKVIEPSMQVGGVVGAAVTTVGLGLFSIGEAFTKGFMTPHRISKLGSYVDTDGLKASYSFGPGVDGDYAYPLTMFKPIYISDATAVGSDFGMVTVPLKDTAIDTKFTCSKCSKKNRNKVYPMADTRLKYSQLIPKPTGVDAAIILNGFNFVGTCDKTRARKSRDPKKKICNSNGIWAYFWEIGIEETKTKSGWRVYARIKRSMNTAKSKTAHKPFNYYMNYDLKVYYTIFVGKKKDALFSKQSAPITGRDEMSDIKGTAAEFEIIGNKNANMKDYVVGINRFKFELSNPPAMGHRYPRGRYFQGLIFGISDDSLTFDKGEVTGQVYMNVYGSRGVGTTTRKSRVDYTMGLTLLQFGSGIAKVGVDEGALGHICQSGNDDPTTKEGEPERSTDFGMDCKLKRIALKETFPDNKGSVSITKLTSIPEPYTLKCSKCPNGGKKVCGQDGITYDNGCIAQCYCVKKVHNGKCISKLMKDAVVKNNKGGKIHTCK